MARILLLVGLTLVAGVRTAPAQQAPAADHFDENLGGAIEPGIAAALAYVNTQQPGEVRDSAASAYIMSNSKTAPADLVALATTITDDNSRSRSLSVATMRWIQEDPTAAKDYVQSSDAFTADQKARVADGKSLWGGGRRGGGGGGGTGGGGAPAAAPAAPAP